MTANTVMQATRTMTPSASAGLPAIATSLCSCGGAGCAICQTQFYVRPQFFAGQLLTEDDLQSLDDYVVAKNRLHTRYLFGAGVVCGLAVTCEPCGGGKVIVNPGYALDCCGNDIVVPCPQTLDINVMVRDLLLRMRGGYDCGDPCAGTGTTSSGQPANAAPATAGAHSTTAARGAAEDAAKALTLPRRYCLYVDYCEQLSDPVTPYAVNDPCGHTICEPTRVREGFRFELRCPEDDDCIPEICKRLWNCIGDPTAAERTFVDSRFLRPYGSRVGRAARAIRAMPEPVLSDEYWAQLPHHTQRLEDALKGLPQLELAREEIEEARLQPLIDAILELAGDVARFWAQADPQYNQDQAQLLLKASNELKEACVKVTSQRIDHALTTTLARVHAHALVEITSHLADESLQRLGTPGAEGARARVTPIRDIVTRYLAERAVFNHRILSAVANSLAVLRDWLVVHIECQPTGKRCTLGKEVSAAPLPPTPAEVSQGNAETLGRSSEILGRAAREVLKDCFCNALNPPCPSCDDTAVLLACLTVEDCEVEEICNLEREFVITGPSIRYWIPELSSARARCVQVCRRHRPARRFSLTSVMCRWPPARKSFTRVQVRSVAVMRAACCCGTTRPRAPMGTVDRGPIIAAGSQCLDDSGGLPSIAGLTDIASRVFTLASLPGLPRSAG